MNIKILTIHTRIKRLNIGGQWQEGAVTGITYLDPNGKPSAASLNGHASQETAKGWLEWCWRNAS